MRTCITSALASMIALTAGSRASADWQVWTSARPERVLRDTPASENRPVQLAAARNEWESFQILMRSDAPLRILKIEAADLAGPSGALLRAARARLFRQHQLHIAQGTHRNDTFKPGWYPDPLIPFTHPVTGKPLEGARFAAIPFDLPADQTHGFWIDVHVPKDAPAGEYRGTYRVTADGGKVVELPVTMIVWDFALPRVSTLRTALGSPAKRMRSHYQQRAKEGKEKEPADWDAVETQCAEMLSRHRINATPPDSVQPTAQEDGTFRIPDEQIDALRQFVDQYHVNALQTVHPSAAVKDPAKERKRLHAWLAAWNEAAKKLNRPGIVLFTYLKDEPNDPEAYRYVQE